MNPFITYGSFPIEVPGIRVGSSKESVWKKLVKDVLYCKVPSKREIENYVMP